MKKKVAESYKSILPKTYKTFYQKPTKNIDIYRENYLMPAIDKKLIKMTYPDNPTNKNQTYYK